MKLLAVAAVGWPRTNPSISPGYWANNSKPAAAAFGGRMFRRIERRTDAQQFHRPGSAYYRAVSIKRQAVYNRSCKAPIQLSATCVTA